MPLLIETLLIFLIAFAIGLGLGWAIWAPKGSEANSPMGTER